MIRQRGRALETLLVMAGAVGAALLVIALLQAGALHLTQLLHLP